jgi:hypothetical protein
MVTSKKITKESIWRAADDLKASGIKVTQNSVREKLGGGSFTTINKALAEREPEADSITEWLKYPGAIIGMLRMGFKHNLPFNKQHLEFLGYIVHDAYQSGEALVQSKYYKSVLQAFAACYVLVEKPTVHQAGYFLSNLYPAADNQQEVLGRVNELVNSMPPLIHRIEAEFGSRNLEVFLRDEINEISIEIVLHALAPFLPDLLAIATRKAYLRSGKPFVDDGDIVYPPSNKISTENYWLHVREQNDTFFAFLGLETHKSIHTTNNFIQFQKFLRLLNEASFKAEPVKDAEYRIVSRSPDAPIYIQYHQHQMEFTQNEFQELRSLFDNAMAQPDIQATVARMISFYGDI